MTPLEARLQALAERDLETWPTMPARLVHVLGPGVDVEVAAGVVDLETREPLRPGSRFRIASVTKPFVAAAALRLVENGRLRLDDPIAALLPGSYDTLLRSGGYDTDAITLRHLLTHTSGIYDFAADAYAEGGSVEGGYEAATLANPGHRWTRLEQVTFAVEHGHPYGGPGDVWAYSDTGACLVGEILERVTGVSMGAAIRELVGYERLGIVHTWQETIEAEPPHAPVLSHQYEQDTDVTTIDASVDLYGGGGLVSTCRDLARFFRALLSGDVFRDPSSLETMTTTMVGVSLTPEAGWPEDPATQAMYLFRREIGGETWWGHDGYWGTTAFTCPARDVTIVAGHQRSNMPEAFDRLEIVASAFEALAEA